MAQLFADAARAYLSTGIAAGDTTISIASGGALFPVANGTDWFKAVLQDSSGIEIVYVTAHTSGANTFTVTRGQEGATARSFAAGSVFGIRVTAADMAAVVAGANNYSHPTGDGNQHVPATGTTNNGKVLKAGSTAGSAAWGNVAYSEVTGKPTLGTAADKNVAATGDASTTQVVLGSDTRLTNARPASDVSAWAKAATKPTYTKSEVGLADVDNTSDASKSVLSATKLTTARTINGVSFDGSANISVSVAWSSVTGKPAVIAAGADAAAARSAIGAGTSNLTLGTTAGTALAGNTTLLPDAPSDGKTYGRKDAAWVEVGGGDGYVTGDVVVTTRTLSTPDYVLPNTVYLQSSYAALFAEIGLIGDWKSSNTKLANPATLPTGIGRGCSWDSSGTYLAVAHDASPFVTVYERSGSTLTKLANPAALPIGTAYGCSWDSSGTYLAVAHTASPFVTVYERSGSTLTKLANPATLPTGTAYGCSWDSSGTYLAVAHDASPFVTVYERSGSTLTKLANPAALPIGTAYGCSWDSSGTYLAVAHDASPFVTVYERSGSTLTKLANPATLPTGTAYGCSWDSSGTYLAVAHTASPFVTVYERSGSTLTKLANPATLPTGTAYGFSWDSSGTYLAVAHTASPFVTVYERSGSTLTKLANPATLPTGTACGCSFTSSSGILAVSHVSTPFITVYSALPYDTSTQFMTPRVSPAQVPPVKTYIKA